MKMYDFPESRYFSVLKSILLIVLLCFSCGESLVEESVETQPETITETHSDPYSDGRVYEGDPFAGFGTVTTLYVPGSPEPEPEEEEVPEDFSGTFSIQIAACNSTENAERLVAAIERETEFPHFIDHVGRYWKVRVGAFMTSEEAVSALEEIRSLGYPDAWVVERAVTE